MTAQLYVQQLSTYTILCNSFFQEKKKRIWRPRCMWSSSALIQSCATHFQEEEEEDLTAQLYVQQLSTYTILCNSFPGRRRRGNDGPTAFEDAEHLYNSVQLMFQEEEEEEFAAQMHVEMPSTCNISCKIILVRRRGRIGGPDVCRREHST